MFACAALAANVTVDAPVTGVTLYSNGFAYSMRAGSVSLPGGSHTLHIINFTDFAIQSSITPNISPGAISEHYYYTMNWNETKNETTYFDLETLLNASIGKQVSFSTGNDSIIGTLVWFSGGRIGISSGSGVTVYNIADLKRITLPATSYSEVKQVNESKSEHGLAIGEKGAAGTASLSLSYLVAGAQWDASYKYYITSEAANGSGTMHGWAGVYNGAGEDWNNVALKLVVGNPRIQSYYSPFRYPYNNVPMPQKSYEAAAGAVPSIDTSFTPSQVSAYYVYALASPATVLQGETRSLPLLEKQIDYKREFFWDTSNTYVEKIFILNNSASESWAPGVASVYLNGEFIGEDQIDYTPKGSEARVTVADLPDIKAKKETLNQTSTANGRTRTTYYKMRLKIDNKMGETVVLRINDRMYSGDEVTLLSSTITPQVKPGNVLEWNVPIAGGNALEVVYEYTVTDYYIEPYY